MSNQVKSSFRTAVVAFVIMALSLLMAKPLASVIMALGNFVLVGSILILFPKCFWTRKHEGTNYCGSCGKKL